MKRSFALFYALFLGLALASFPPAAPAQAQPAHSLEDVLKLMDQHAHDFKTVETDFVWDHYQRLFEGQPEAHEIQKGKMYFRRNGENIEMKADIDPQSSSEPQKYVLFTGGDVQVYDYKPGGIDRVTRYSAGKNKAAFESLLVLGFGGSGHDLLKTFNVKLAATEDANGISNTYRLDLTPKSERIRGMFQTIVLWIDPVRGISVQQKLIEPNSGDYRLAKYSNIRLNTNLPGDVFKLKTTSRTEFITPKQ
jgi:outer membrane lipoprotein-sorting protein